MKNKAEGRRQKVEGRRIGMRPDTSGTKLFLCLFSAFYLLPSTFCLLPSATAAPSVADNAPHGPLTFDSFKLIHTRNVFDPDRRPVRPAGPSTTSAGRSDYLALTGTLLDATKSYAFFSGSRMEFNKVLSVGDKIANAKVTQITPVNIVVERDGRSTTVAVGQTVPLDAKSVPGAAPVPDVTATSTNDTAAPGNAAPANAAPANAAPGAPAAPGGKPPTGSKEDLIRKMMERRQQDLK